jgi:hypothetical protein
MPNDRFEVDSTMDSQACLSVVDDEAGLMRSRDFHGRTRRLKLDSATRDANNRQIPECRARAFSTRPWVLLRRR